MKRLKLVSDSDFTKIDSLLIQIIKIIKVLVKKT